jgi:urea-proton symporter
MNASCAGYVIVMVFGIVIALITAGIVWLDQTYGSAKSNTESFTTAGRSVKTGLIACVVCSQWTWAATLLQSSNVAFQYGVSGPFWYAAGATIQVILFGILAVQIKRRAPGAHTMLEIVKARWGKVAHIVFFCFAIVTNIIVTSMLLLGGAAVMNSLTGMNLYAAAMLIPVGVLIYTAVGGLRGTFISSYINAVIIFAALVMFTLVVYATNDDLGSPGKVWSNLTVMADPSVPGSRPVDGNKQGSYVTMFSTNGLIFGVINVVGNFGTVFVDQAYWLGAIASKPSATYKGYILGGMMWFSIPFALATSLGLASVALDLPISASEAGAGLVPPAVAIFLLGKFGGVAMTVMLFCAVTGTGSSEMMAVSTLFTFDLYRGYINPKATDKQLLMCTRICVTIFGLLMGVFAIILFEIGLSLGWVYLFMGILVAPAVFPLSFALTWNKASAAGAIIGAVTAMLLGLMTWLVTCQGYYGSITIDNLGGNYPMLAGNLVSFIMGGVICAVISLIKPQNYDFARMKEEIGTIADDETGTKSMHDLTEAENAEMDRALKIMIIIGWGLTIVLLIMWPLLALAAGVFPEGYFTFWVILSMAWGFAAALVATFLPLFESGQTMVQIFKNLISCTKSVKSTPTPAATAKDVSQKSGADLDAIKDNKTDADEP